MCYWYVGSVYQTVILSPFSFPLFYSWKRSGLSLCPVSLGRWFWSIEAHGPLFLLWFCSWRALLCHCPYPKCHRLLLATATGPSSIQKVSWCFLYGQVSSTAWMLGCLARSSLLLFWFLCRSKGQRSFHCRCNVLDLLLYANDVHLRYQKKRTYTTINLYIYRLCLNLEDFSLRQWSRPFQLETLEEWTT